LYASAACRNVNAAPRRRANNGVLRYSLTCTRLPECSSLARAEPEFSTASSITSMRSSHQEYLTTDLGQVYLGDLGSELQ
jgi:hypothetical protein